MIRFHRTYIPTLLVIVIALLAACSRSSSPATTGVEPGAAEPITEDSARVLMQRVERYYKNMAHDSLADLTPKAMNHFRNLEMWKEYYTTWCLLVNDLVWNGQMDRGFDEAQMMHKDAIRRNNEFGLSEAYTAMGIAYHFQKHHTESAECYRQALKHFPDEADQSVKLNIYSYYCQVLVEMGDDDATGAVLAEWRAFLDKLTGGDTESDKNVHYYFRYHRESFRYRYSLRQFREAAKELDSMQVCLNKESDREVYEAQVAGFRTQLSTARNDYATALDWSNREIELCRQQDNNTFLNALRHRTEMLQALGHYEEALEAYHVYDHQKDSLISAENRQQLNELHKRFEVDELKAHHERNHLKHQRQILLLTLLLTSTVVVTLIIFILYRYRAAKRLEEAHRLLEMSNEELQESYEQLKIANGRAQEASKMKSDFINQISHEIRTPLNILSGFTQIVTTPGIELDDEQKADVSRRITENTDRITRLVNKMLELSEANSKAVIHCEDWVPAEVIANQAVEESGIKRAAHIEFYTFLGDDAKNTVLRTNLKQAVRALIQLLDNAQKFTKEGSVRLFTKMTPTSASFIVEDTGIGIPVYEAEHIFGEFVQLDEYYDGTGIGLAVARNIARRLGGDVMLDTTYTHGARFLLILPLSNQ